MVMIIAEYLIDHGKFTLGGLVFFLGKTDLCSNHNDNVITSFVIVSMLSHKRSYDFIWKIIFITFVMLFVVIGHDNV